MPGKVGLLVIHGIGSPQVGYSQPLQNEINHRLKGDVGLVEWEEVFWSDVLAQREMDLFNSMKNAKDPNGSRLPLEWMSIREFLIHNFGDASAYNKGSVGAGNAYDDIHDRVSKSIKKLDKKLNNAKAPIIVLAHSLGAYIMSNYIWDVQGDNKKKRATINQLTGFVSFGCNIPLFSLSFPKAVPFDLPDKKVTRSAIKSVSKWLNYYDRDDVLGWPMKPLYEKNKAALSPAKKTVVNRIQDYEINSGSFLTSWNPAAHNGYWTDNDFTIPATEYIRKVIKAA